ncbi:hypothetical protein J6590_021088 [Homalodisca vitripennis]|nr:hypothetical protein J6590_021088 [Homalodisca vitripennis]
MAGKDWYYGCIRRHQELSLRSPEVRQKKKKIVRKQGKTAILTSSPYKAELEAAVAKKQLEEKIKKERKEKRHAKSKEQNGKKNNGKQVKQKSKKLKRKLSYPFDDSENNSEDNPKKSQPSTTKTSNSNNILDSKNKKKLMKSPIRAQTKKRQKRRAYSVTNCIATQKPTKVGSSAEAAGDGLMKHVQNAKR